MPVVKEVVAVTGTYTDSNGNEKKRYARLGSIIETKKGKMLKIEIIPLDWDGWAYLNDPKDKEEQPQRRNPNAGSRAAPMAKQSMDDFSDDDIPF